MVPSPHIQPNDPSKYFPASERVIAVDKEHAVLSHRMQDRALSASQHTIFTPHPFARHASGMHFPLSPLSPLSPLPYLLRHVILTSGVVYFLTA
jgi:hypothetical protein